jgi:predicted enzyme related to lactoylglutathione lyase
MTQFLGLRTVIYKVGDVEKGKDFYNKLLGFAPYFDQPFYVGYNVAGYELGLQPDDFTGKTAENLETYWGVENIETCYAQMLLDGATPNAAPQNVGDDIFVATVKDPWGNLIGIIQNPHFGK